MTFERDTVSSSCDCDDRIRCTILERDEGAWDERSSRSFPHGLVIDDGCPTEWLVGSVQATRLKLPLNAKRPTVDRRFCCDTTREAVATPLEAIVRRALGLANQSPGDAWTVHCNKYLRFLEYTTVGGGLLPHRDGIKTCEDTGLQSTHTLLLFLSDCERGGETLIMDDSQGNGWSRETHLVLDDACNDTHRDENARDTHNRSRDPSTPPKPNPRRLRYPVVDAAKSPPCRRFRLRDATFRSIQGNEDEKRNEDDCAEKETIEPANHVSAGIQPHEGRILVFPHHWPHAGALCRSVPKIALRAELTIVARS